MDQATHNKIVSFIWGIADDVLRDLFRRGRYPDVILPMCVIRRMDAVLEPTKPKVLETKAMLDAAGITEQRAALCDAAGQAFYNTSKFTLRDLKCRGSQQQLLADFEDYLNGFSPNVQDILENFKFRNQLSTLSKNDAIGTLINKFLDPEIDLSPAGIDNHAMGTVFEELVRKFNEENNEEAGEHWTPRDAVRLMANLVFLPIETQIKSGTYLLYDCACGTGGMLTVGEETLTAIGAKRGQQITCLLYGQEINPETYAVCKADMLLKGEGESAEHIVGGAEWSTLSHDAFAAQEFDFMLANPPYGKSWKKDLEAMGGKDGMRDPRFKVMHQGEELSLVTRASDGQMLFLANMASKMNAKSALGSRIAEVHNGSSLFTGDAGQGESSIRRWLIENDWLEAIVALPLNLFYNTGIATYIWVLSNRKPAHRQGQVQLIDASQWFKPLRKNLGQKNCELAPADIDRISRTFLDFQESPESKIFPNAAFGYWKVTVERPLRLHSQISLKAVETLRFASGHEDLRATLYDELGDALFTAFASLSAALETRLADWGSDDDAADDDEGDGAKKGLPEKTRKKLLDPKTWERDGRLVAVATTLREALGDSLFEDHNIFRDRVDAALEQADIKVPAADLKQILKAVSWRVETAPPVVAKVHKPGKAKADTLRGLFESTVNGKPAVVEYEPDSDLRDTEQVPLLEQGGIEAFIRRYRTRAGARREAASRLEAPVVIADLKPYADYKESGLPWLGAIPQHWSSERAKWLFTKPDLAKGILEAIDMDSYRVEKKAAMKIALADADAEIGPVPTDSQNHKAEPELDRLSNILKAFNDQFGTLFSDTDRVAQRIRDDIAPKVAADAAYQNAKENTPHTARMAHDQALGRVMQLLLRDDTQVYKQFVENESFKRFVGDMVYDITKS